MVLTKEILLTANMSLVGLKFYYILTGIGPVYKLHTLIIGRSLFTFQCKPRIEFKV